MDDPSITVQFVYGSVGVTAQLDGVRYSPDVFNDILVQGIRALKQVMPESGEPPTQDAWQAHTHMNDLLEALSDDDD